MPQKEDRGKVGKRKDRSFVEEVWFLYGLKVAGRYFGRLAYRNDGQVAQVRFDWAQAFFNKFGGTEANWSLIGFYHTHPGGHPSPSSTDDETMGTWVKSMGKPMLCGIISGDNQKCYLYQRATEDRKDPESSRIVCHEIESKLHVIRGGYKGICLFSGSDR